MAKAFVKGDHVGLVMTKYQAEVLLRILYSHIRGGGKGRNAVADSNSFGSKCPCSALQRAGVSPDNTNSFSGYIDINNK